MSDSRLGGGKRTPITNCVLVTKLHILKQPSMTVALNLSRRQFWERKLEKDTLRQEAIGDRPVDGNKERLKSAMEMADKLSEEAIFFDNRLARRAQWLRRDEGEYCDSGLLAQGDDQPFYKHTRTIVNDATQAGEPLRVVISTDDSSVPPGTAAAFIATARIVQQFMPLEIWWQGAWLNGDRSRGFVNLVPLVQGDMDFARLEFCIADPHRDMFSFQAMASQAVLDLREVWNNCGYRAERSYIDGARFVAHTGIEPTAESIANAAATWLGWETAFWNNIELESMADSAAQELPPEPVKHEPYKESAAERRRWDAWWNKEQRAERRSAKSRLNQ